MGYAARGHIVMNLNLLLPALFGFISP